VKTIIFIGLYKSGSSREAVKAARNLGYLTIVFTDKEEKIKKREEYSDVHQLVLLDINNIDELKKQVRILQHKGNEIVAITSFVDPYVHTASLLADEFCHNYLSTDAIYIMENKEETRMFFSNEPYTPAFVLVDKDTPISLITLPDKLNYPVMVKGSKSSGSKDVIYAGNQEELKRNAAELRDKYPDETILIEEYIDGKQYLAEVIVFNGQMLRAALIEQEITRGERFIITGYGVLAEVQPHLEESLGEIIQSITSLLEIKNGSFHIELRLVKDGWKLIEINPRISGGAMNRMIQVAFGYNLVEETLKILVGDTPSLEKKSNNFVFTQHVIIAQQGVLEKVTGRDKAMKSPGVVEVFVRPKKGTIVLPPMRMGHRYAYVMAVGGTMEEAKKLAKEAAKEIKFHLRIDE
jgi:biotin carboxylase